MVKSCNIAKKYNRQIQDNNTQFYFRCSGIPLSIIKQYFTSGVHWQCGCPQNTVKTLLCSCVHMFYYRLYRSLKNQTTLSALAAAGTKAFGCIITELCLARPFEFNTMNVGTVDVSQISVKLKLQCHCTMLRQCKSFPYIKLRIM